MKFLIKTLLFGLWGIANIKFILLVCAATNLGSLNILEMCVITYMQVIVYIAVSCKICQSITLDKLFGDLPNEVSNKDGSISHDHSVVYV